MAESLNTLRNLDEGSELRGAEHLAGHHVTHPMLGKERIPDVGLELLHAQRKPAILRFDAEDNRTDLFALLEHVRRMLDPLGPAQVRDMHQAIDAVLDLDERSEVSEIADPAFNDRAGR